MPLFLEMLRRETAADPALMDAALKGLRAYQEAPRHASMPIMPATYELHGVTLRDYGGSGRPLLFVPSLINPPSVLDLSEERSLLRWLTARGYRVLLVDWGVDAQARRALSIAGHVEQILLPFIRQLDCPPVLAGYCLGGTMAMGAAACAPVAGLALIAAPWRFGGYEDKARALLAASWRDAEAIVDAIGVLPMEVLQSAFWLLDPHRTVSKFAGFAALQPDDPRRDAFVILEDWANDGPPLPAAAARELFEGFFVSDLPGSCRWQVENVIVDPRHIPCPILEIVSTTDRIAPATTACGVGQRVELQQGHVGMMVGSRAPVLLGATIHGWIGTVAKM